MNFDDAEEAVDDWLRSLRGGSSFSTVEGDAMIDIINNSDATRERKAGLAKRVVEHLIVHTAETHGFEATAAALNQHIADRRPKLTLHQAQTAVDELTSALFAGEREWCMDEIERVFEDCCNALGTNQEKDALIEELNSKLVAFTAQVHGADAVNAVIDSE